VTLRTRLTAAIVAVVAVPLLVFVLLLSSALPAAVGDRQSSSVATSARLAAQLVAADCDRARGAAEAAGRAVLATPAGAPEQQTAALRSLVDRGLAQGLRVTDAQGRLTTAGRVTDTPRDCATGELGGQDERTLTAVARLQQEGQPTAGEAVAQVATAAELLERVRAALGVAGAQAALVDDDGLVAGPAPAAPLGDLRQARGATVEAGDAVGALVPVGSGPLAVVVSEPVGDGIDVLRTGLLVVVAAVLLGGALALLLARALTRPLEQLSQAAARVASGDLATTIDVRSKDEVGVLAGAFNSMTDELRGYVGALEASRDELRAGLARLGETLTSTHDLDRILAVVLETALATSAAQAGAVLLVDPSGESAALAVGRGLEGRMPGPGLRVRLGEGVLGRVAQHGVPLQGETVHLSPAAQEPTAASVIAVPLRGRDTVLGVLALYDPRGDGVGSEEDLTTLRTLAGQAAVAVENVLLHRDVSRMAVTDGLTGLANYRSFTQTIAREMERATRFGRPIGLLLLDIDHFKLVNDTHGHPRGDAVLIELAARVRAQVRDVDTVARYGGEELVVVLPETDLAGAEQAAERIRAAVRGRPFGAPGQVPLAVTVSLGVAVHPRHGATATALLRAADEALYDAKRAGRDRWRSAAHEPDESLASTPH
jgi:two-component system cell cycle response regulator